ncbi:SRPBCC family protein [Dyadobacter sp. CY345]|uniref:SRPBCC family protein n=1 Tax=Dyadobacter sp. CY345 TaxID=2909335 RepID=UPI001F41E2E2|nr:SRPBCC family protein [Dyadobacter sp. CY345]MCF2443482.1 SRPBCC family protein [Dyadobacter sp. CY345]
MEAKKTPAITVEALINAPTKKVWEFWTEPQHITKWTFASDDWHAPYAENDLRIDGKFKTTMAAKDGSMSFDFEGVYTDVQTYKLIQYVLGDGREVSISFDSEDNVTTVTETFDPESENSIELQRDGWQAILDNFKNYVETAV